MQIFVEQLEFVGAHGVYDEERREGRRFKVDLSVEVEESRASRSDELVDTIDYRGLADCILEIGHGESCALIEHMADRILGLVLARFPSVDVASITIRKFATGVPGSPACVGVTLDRVRSL